MQRKLETGQALDVSIFEMDAHGDFLLPGGFFRPNVDYVDIINETWIGSIGRHKDTGQVIASTLNKFYQNPKYDCLWLR